MQDNHPHAEPSDIARARSKGLDATYVFVGNEESMARLSKAYDLLFEEVWRVCTARSTYK